MMRKDTILVIVVLVTLGLGLNACSKSSGPPPSPGEPLLTFPEQNSECTTGVEQSPTTSEVTFQWQPADNATSYALRIRNVNTLSSLPTINTAETSAAVSLEKGEPYSWTVTASNTDIEDTAVSSTWLFFNAGAQSTYPPFPASLQSPASGATVSADSDGQVRLDWISNGDVDGDLRQFEVRFSDSNPPVVINTISSDFSDFQVDVTSGSGTVYYWQIVAIDLQGNRSESPILGFRVQ